MMYNKYICVTIVLQDMTIHTDKCVSRGPFQGRALLEMRTTFGGQTDQFTLDVFRKKDPHTIHMTCVPNQTFYSKPSWWYYFLVFFDKNHLPAWKKKLLCGKHALLGGYRHFSLGLMLVQNYRMAERKAKKTAVQVFSWVTDNPSCKGSQNGQGSHNKYENSAARPGWGSKSTVAWSLPPHAAKSLACSPLCQTQSWFK